MKIVLPKTLAEPLTIPWDDFIASDDVSEMNISEALHRLIDRFERANAMPKSTTSQTKGLCTILAQQALEAGADQASSSSFPMIESQEHVGNEYIVLFALPNGKGLFTWTRKSWYGVKATMYPS